MLFSYNEISCSVIYFYFVLFYLSALVGRKSLCDTRDSQIGLIDPKSSANHDSNSNTACGHTICFVVKLFFAWRAVFLLRLSQKATWHRKNGGHGPHEPLRGRAEALGLGEGHGTTGPGQRPGSPRERVAEARGASSQVFYALAGCFFYLQGILPHESMPGVLAQRFYCCQGRCESLPVAIVFFCSVITKYAAVFQLRSCRECASCRVFFNDTAAH